LRAAPEGGKAVYKELDEAEQQSAGCKDAVLD
jgi:hypothetical protein